MESGRLFSDAIEPVEPVAQRRWRVWPGSMSFAGCLVKQKLGRSGFSVFTDDAER